MDVKRTTDPTEYPITLAEAKAHMRVDDSDDDTLITACIAAATEYCQDYTGKQFVTATFTGKFDTLYGVIALPYPPLQSVTSITYIDTDGEEQTVSTDVYGVDTYGAVGQVFLKYEQSWPTDVRGHTQDVTIVYVAGMGAASAVPENVKAAVKLVTADLYENREPVVTGTIVANLDTVNRLLWSVMSGEMF